MTNAEAKRMIERTYQRLVRITQSSRNDSRYFDMCEAEERDHRRFMSHGGRIYSGKLSVRDSAKLFYVRNVFAAMIGDAPDPADFFALKKSVFGGYALYKEHAKAIRAEFDRAEVDRFADIDYSELVKS